MPLIRSILTNKEGSFHKLKSLDQHYKVVLLTKHNPKRRPASFRPKLRFYLLGRFVKAFLNLSQPTRPDVVLINPLHNTFFDKSSVRGFELITNWIYKKNRVTPRWAKYARTILGYLKLSTLYTNLILFFNLSGIFLKLTSSSFVRVKFL